MSLAFAAHGRAEIGPVALWITPLATGFDPFQQALAEQIAAELDTVRHLATRYLDLFVDRARACGKADEDWWLDEIDLRPATAERPIVHVHFALDGDDNGLWTVDMKRLPDSWWPIRFERLQH